MRSPKRPGEQPSRSPNYVLYPKLGPPPAIATQRYGRERAEKMVAAFGEWRRRYGDAWDHGDVDEPDPPHWQLWR